MRSDDAEICQGDGTDLLKLSLNCIWIIPVVFAIGMTTLECLCKPGRDGDDKYQEPSKEDEEKVAA